MVEVTQKLNIKGFTIGLIRLIHFSFLYVFTAQFVVRNHYSILF